MNIGAAVMCLVGIIALGRFVLQHFRLYKSGQR